MTTLLAWPNGKAKYINRVRKHRKLDELVQGSGYEIVDGKPNGCAVGCMVDAYDHRLAAEELGYPEGLIHLCDAIHEGLPRSVAIPKDPEKPSWVERFMCAKKGADLSLVLARFAVWNLTDKKWGAVALPDQPAEAIECCRAVAALWQRVIDGESQESLRTDFLKQEDLAWAGAGAGAWARAGAWAGAGAGAGAGAEKYWKACAVELERLIQEA